MKLIKLILALLIISCNNSNIAIEASNENNIVNKINYSDSSLNSLLKCGNYSYMGSYFTIADYGCIYQSSAINKIGNVEIYLIPREKLNEIDIEKEENKINTMNIDDLKKTYEIYLLLIDKKYLKQDPNKDVTYYPTLPYDQIIFNFSNLWKQVKTLHITQENDPQYHEWKKKLEASTQVLNNNIQELQGNYFIHTKTTSIETGDPISINYYFHFENNKAILSTGSENSLEAYCEGSYSISQNGDYMKLEYAGEEICTSDKDESTFIIKTENNEYYIKSKRFYNNTWQVMSKNN